MTNMLLPNKPSELITVALDDLRRCEEDARYAINMWATWHAPSFQNDGSATDVCYVCMAGAVMAQTLGEDIDTNIFPSSYDTGLQNKLSAIDELRCGNISLALMSLELSPSAIPDRDIVSYREETVDQFHKQMHAFAQDLKEVGL